MRDFFVHGVCFSRIIGGAAQRQRATCFKIILSVAKKTEVTQLVQRLWRLAVSRTPSAWVSIAQRALTGWLSRP